MKRMKLVGTQSHWNHTLHSDNKKKEREMVGVLLKGVERILLV